MTPRHHKSEQLATQVRRALDAALMGQTEDPLLLDVEILAVEPDREGSTMHVQFTAHGELGAMGPGEIQQRLGAATGLLLQEVAQSINRRKVPELLFRWVPSAPPAAED